jgi:hypothetical protein
MPILALFVIFPKDKVDIKGPATNFVSKGGSGLDVYRTFCSVCGSGIAQAPDAAPGVIAIKGGSLDREVKKNLKPVCILTSMGLGIEANSWIIRMPSSGPPQSFHSARRIWLTPLSICLQPNKQFSTSYKGDVME